jgi:hypothetical protein
VPRSCTAQSLLLAAGLFATAGASAQYITPAPGKIRVWIEDIPMSSGAAGVYARNTGGEVLVFNYITLHDCANLVQTCDQTTYDRELKPGETHLFLRLEPLQRGQTMRYSITYHFTPPTHPTRDITRDSVPPPDSAAAAAAANHPAEIRVLRSTGMLTDPAQWVARVPIGRDAGECRPSSNAPHDPSHHYVLMLFPRGQTMARLISIETDGAGSIFQYNETRTEPPPKHSPTNTPNTQTTITVVPNMGIAMVTNTGGGSPDQVLTIQAPNLLNAPSLGFPGSNARQILKACDGKH